MGNSVWLQFAVFLGGATAVWVAGTRLSNDTDVLAHRLNLGQALGGLLVLAVVTNLPEVAITVSAARQGALGLAVGNILGGIAVQTVVLAVLDAVGLRKRAALTHHAASLVLVLEGVLVVAVLAIVVMGAQMHGGRLFLRIEPASVARLATWLVGLWLVVRARRGLPWHDEGRSAPGGQALPMHQGRKRKSEVAKEAGRSTSFVAVSFAVSAAVTLVGGVLLAHSGEELAAHFGISGVVFGATVLAAITALPEISTGLAAMRLDDVQMAVADIFGGNAFLPVLFLVAGLISGKAVLPETGPYDLYLAALGVLLTTVYIVGFVFRPRRQLGWLGPDSVTVLALYAIGIVGLVAIAH
jgi:cation:H+ antiporter